MPKIAVDVMGGDHGSGEVVRGVISAAFEQSKDLFLLVGDESEIRQELARTKPVPQNIKIIHTTEVIGMNESPVEAIRGKKDSSLVKAIGLVAQGKADAVLSPGNTGAVVAGATFLLGLLEGVKRPGIAIPLPTENGHAYLIDVGANIHCNPVHLLQYGIMASVYCQHLQNIHQPRVGLLNIGSEDNKGNELVKYTIQFFKKAGLNFTGNIEGQDIFSGTCDVVVCEGFLGNVILKYTEGLVEFLLHNIQKNLMESSNSRQSTQSTNQALSKIKSRADYTEHGGAPLLGVDGVCIICHGRSRARAFVNAFKVATQIVQLKVNQGIRRAIQGTHLSWFDLLRSWRASRRGE
ncbi:Phosphate acyltransferase [subsurface metagenome]